MAQDKKGFILYADLIHTLEKLPNDLAGELFKHILRYVNDQEPKTENFTVDLVFEQIKQQLKRDLKKYETRAERSRLNGLKGGRPKNPKEPRKPSGLKNNPDEPRKPDKEKGIGIDTDIGIVKVKDILLKKETKKGVSIIFPFDSLEFLNSWSLWKDYKKDEHNFKYKSATSEQAALKKLCELANGSEETAINIINQSLSNGWKGFFKLDENGKNGTGKSKGATAEQIQRVFDKHFN